MVPDLTVRSICARKVEWYVQHSLDALAACKYLQGRADLASDVFLYGQSLGGAVAIGALCSLMGQRQGALTTEFGIRGLVLENT